jgi:hypothetical protein
MLGAVAAAGVLSLVGCLGLIGVPPDEADPGPAVDFDRFAQPALRLAPGSDDAPLHIGAWWSFRDATADHLPTWQPGAGREDRVLCTVDGGDGRECFVVRTTFPDGHHETRYVHRGEEGWLLLARNVGGGPERLDPAVALLRLPFEADGAPWRWTYDLIDKVVDVQIIFTEMVSVSAGVFPECHKLKLWRMDAAGCRCHSSAEAEFMWYAKGVGLVKWVTGSRSYELRASSFTDRSSTHVLRWQDREGSLVADPGDRLVVQLPVAWDAPARWRLSADPVDAVSLVEEHLEPDLGPTSSSEIAYGSYVAEVQIAESATAGTAVRLVWSYGLVGDIAIHRFDVSVHVR